MTRKIGIALAVVSLLAVVAAIVHERSERRARAARTQAHLPSFDDRSVSGIVLTTPGASWRLVRASSGWRISTPVDDLADRGAVEALIAAVRRAPIVKTLDAPDDLSSYGLDPPRARLALEGVTTPTLDIGRVSPTGDAVYARVDGRPQVLLLGLPAAAPLAEADPAALRNRSLVDLARSEVVGLTIAPNNLRLARAAEGWWIAGPRRFPAAPSRVDKLLGALYGAKVLAWDDRGDASDPRYGLGEGAARVTLSAERASRTITLGADAGEGKRYALSEGRKTILIAQAPPQAWLPFDLAALRETKLTNVNRYDVTRLVYAARDARFAATRNDDGSWTTDGGGAVPAESILTLLVALLEAETVSVGEGRLKGTPDATVQYTTGTGGAGKLSFDRDHASWDAIPGVVFRLAVAPPPVPPSP